MGGMAGFFRDHYGEDCVIQKSQQRDGDYLWLGLELEDTGKGSQMLLTREQVRDLIPHLFQFALRGTLDPPAKLIPEAKALKMELK